MDDGGWEVPADFGDDRQEYRIAREAAALFDLSHSGKIIIRGRDRVKFLQGLLTQDIPKIGRAPKTHPWAYAPPVQSVKLCWQ